MEMSQMNAPSRVNSQRSVISTLSVPENESDIFPVDGAGAAGSPLVAKAVISKWGPGKMTIFLIAFFYLLAFIIAIIHLILFQYLDGKPASRIHGIPQTYITTTSNILAYLFATTIKIALAITFAQHLWYIMRHSALKVSTIEVLFNLRSNPLQFFHLSAFKTTWILVLLAFMLYIIPIATSFPPGALTIKSSSSVTSALHKVPSFNASYIGNGSLGDALSTTISPQDLNLEFTSNSTWATELFSGAGVIFLGSLQRLSTAIIVTGKPLPMSSPCGPNCSYTIEFEGPVFECYTSAKSFEVSDLSLFGDEINWDQAALNLDNFVFSADLPGNSTNNKTVFRAPPLFYEGTWSFPGGVENVLGPTSNNTESQGVYTEASFIVSTLNSTNFLTPPITVTQSNLSCIPSRALYTVTNSYNDNIQNLAYTTGPSTQLTNTLSLMLLNGTYSGTSGPEYPMGELIGNWSDELLSWWRDCQLMSLIQQVSYSLNGTYLSDALYMYSNQTGSLEQINSNYDGIGSAFTFVANSRLNTAFEDYDLSLAQDTGSDSSISSFNVTQEALNKMVGDLTISAIIAYGIWSDSVNVSTFPSENVYTFSRPVNLLVPYFLSLALAFPFLFIGAFALYKNGVPATDGGFIQILSTTTGSASLQKAAAGNCLGGEEEIPKELKDLEIQFGELIEEQVTSGGELIRRAGFGTKGEIGPLLKGERYGAL